ncbi:hypothetical protein [Streptomyces sp. V4I2]|uniref:hypothetical protein n=1 Tax=Streptomyces sp. V4I2 TaxID=3042280 RepID=UPI00278164D5|nr:hypothetical protein [Streptomyces sp. V4I2]MDQ1051818.1 hypothetical protein [Streptomyces sp. V4I2]
MLELVAGRYTFWARELKPEAVADDQGGEFDFPCAQLADALLVRWIPAGGVEAGGGPSGIVGRPRGQRRDEPGLLLEQGLQFVSYRIELVLGLDEILREVVRRLVFRHPITVLPFE